MIRTKMIGSVANQRHNQPIRNRKRAAHRRPSSPCRLRLERLEDRLAPSLTSVFEIDGNAIDQSSTVSAAPDDWNSALQKVTPNPILPASAAPPGSSHAL